MCGLYGFSDPQHKLTANRKTRLLAALANAAEVRGTDAAGIAYNLDGRLRVYKRPWPAHLMHFRIPEEAVTVMGHTRMTTQGNEKRNYNNHPFLGRTHGQGFALAHNGMVSNDHDLRKELALPATKIETDSYIAVQLLEAQGRIGFDSLQSMAEQLLGSFTITVMDEENNLYIVKGDNPMCVYHFPKAGVYLYASTENILHDALRHASPRLGQHRVIELKEGDILRIDGSGDLTWGKFNAEHLWRPWHETFWPSKRVSRPDNSYLSELKAMAGVFGFTAEEIEEMYLDGFSPSEIEEYLYSVAY